MGAEILKTELASRCKERFPDPLAHLGPALWRLHKKGPKKYIQTTFSKTVRAKRHTHFSTSGQPTARTAYPLRELGAPLPPAFGGAPKFRPQLGFPGAPSRRTTSGPKSARRNVPGPDGPRAFRPGQAGAKGPSISYRYRRPQPTPE